MKKRIVVINGSGGVGKDTFVNMCKNYVKIINKSTIDKPKEAAKILDWDGEKNEVNREFLSDLKLLWTKYNDGPFKYATNEIQKFKDDMISDVLFLHVREPFEIFKLKKAFDCVTVLIINDNVEKIDSNMADANVHKYPYDYIIDNSTSLSDLEWKAKEFIRTIFK